MFLAPLSPVSRPEAINEPGSPMKPTITSNIPAKSSSSPIIQQPAQSLAKTQASPKRFQPKQVPSNPVSFLRTL
jgi:hypothetical protein